MAQLVDREKAAARVRAAMAFAGIEHDDVAAGTGINVATLRRIASKTTPRGASIEELWAIADACQVPRPFMESGFETGTIDLQELQEDVKNLKGQMETVLRVLSTSVAASIGGATTPRRGRAGSEGA